VLAAIHEYDEVGQDVFLGRYGFAPSKEHVVRHADQSYDSKVLLGAHLIGPHASSLIQPLIQAMSFSQTAPDVARGQYWIHPAMTEVIENALLGLAD
jgi:mycothione reductase